MRRLGAIGIATALTLSAIGASNRSQVDGARFNALIGKKAPALHAQNWIDRNGVIRAADLSTSSLEMALLSLLLDQKTIP